MIITYQLFKYGLASDEEEMVFEHQDQRTVERKALELSHDENIEFAEEHGGFGYWTYRIEKCANGERSGGWRFFNYSGEFTQVIRECIAKQYLN